MANKKNAFQKGHYEPINDESVWSHNTTPVSVLPATKEQQSRYQAQLDAQNSARDKETRDQLSKDINPESIAADTAKAKRRALAEKIKAKYADVNTDDIISGKDPGTGY